jgi:hypothetical protein
MASIISLRAGSLVDYTGPAEYQTLNSAPNHLRKLKFDLSSDYS